MSSIVSYENTFKDMYYKGLFDNAPYNPYYLVKYDMPKLLKNSEVKYVEEIIRRKLIFLLFEELHKCFQIRKDKKTYDNKQLQEIIDLFKELTSYYNNYTDNLVPHSYPVWKHICYLLNAQIDILSGNIKLALENYNLFLQCDKFVTSPENFVFKYEVLYNISYIFRLLGKSEFAYEQIEAKHLSALNDYNNNFKRDIKEKSFYFFDMSINAIANIFDKEVYNSCNSFIEMLIWSKRCAVSTNEDTQGILIFRYNLDINPYSIDFTNSINDMSDEVYSLF